MSGTKQVDVDDMSNITGTNQCSNPKVSLQAVFNKVLDVDKKVDVLQSKIDQILYTVLNNRADSSALKRFDFDNWCNQDSSSSDSGSSAHISVTSREDVVLDSSVKGIFSDVASPLLESKQPYIESGSASKSFEKSPVHDIEMKHGNHDLPGDNETYILVEEEEEEEEYDPQTSDQTVVGSESPTTDKNASAIPGSVEESMFCSDNKPWSQYKPEMNRAESPLPIANSSGPIDLTQLKRKQTKRTDDNRVKYFKKTGQLITDTQAAPNQEQEDTETTDLSSFGAGGLQVVNTSGRNDRFVPNNQLIPASGLKNDHGPYLDNRFKEDAHSDTPLFLDVTETQLLNMGVIQNVSRQNDVVPRRAENTTHTKTPPAVKQMEQLTKRKATNVRDGTQDVDPFVGDAFIQALLQTERHNAERNREPKSQGLDTVICIDTSESMMGEPLTKAQQIVLAFLDGLETAAVDFELEENVAIVTFGKTNKVQQHLTNNYDAVRNIIETLEAGGPSPMWLGVALALAELGARGGSCKMSDAVILPRIIVLSDGYATQKNRLHGIDSTDNTDYQTIQQIQSLIAKNQNCVSKIDCVTFGVYNKPLLSTLSGEVYTEEDLPYLIGFFRSKQITNNCLVECRDQKITKPQQLINIVEKYHGLQNQRLMNDVLSELKTRLCLSDGEVAVSDEEAPEDLSPKATDTSSTEDAPPKQATPTDVTSTIYSRTTNTEYHQDTPPTQDTPTKDTQAEPESFVPTADLVSNQFNVNPDKTLPVFGTRVEATESYEAYDIYTQLTGTVVGHRKDCVKVLWPDGKMLKCRYGQDGKYDVVRREDDGDIDNKTMEIGTKVQRGADWKWGEQDGGEGSVGFVFKVDNRKKIVHAIWPNNQQGNYRFGYKGAFDVQLIPEETDSPVRQSVVWQIELSESEWSNFPTEVSESMEDMYMSKPKNTFLIRTNDKQYRISLVKNEARDIDVQVVYPIRRQLLTNDEE